jgi:hypothetical protein
VTKRFVIKRRDHYELTTVDSNGQEHVHKDFPLNTDRPRGEFFTQEGPYRRAIEAAVAEASG